MILGVFRCRRFSSVRESSLSVIQGTMLNRFAGTAEASEYSQGVEEDDTEDMFEDDDRPSPIVAQIQKSKPVILGGEGKSSALTSTSSVSARDMARGFRSKRSEELYKLSHMVFDGDVKVRVMDVDQFSLDELHHYFMYTLVRRFPAEKCVRVASRIALFRDKNSQHSFESMSKDVAALFGPVHGPELTALFSRCHNTIPIAFMLDYTRRFGKFSRRYIALEVQKTTTPRLFDFVRYASGVKPLPGIVTRPFALRSFARLLPPCSAKRYIFQHLMAHSGEPVTGADAMDPLLGIEARVGESVVTAWRKTKRPDQLIESERDVYSKQPVAQDDIVKAIESGLVVDGEKTSVDALDLQTMQVQAFKSPLMDDSTELANIDSEESGVSDVCGAGDDEERSDDSWWKGRRISTDFFRYNKKAYRRDDEGGWKQIEDPRGEPLDYARAKKLREGRRKVVKMYERQTRQKNRNSLINRTIANRLRQM